MTHSVDPVDAAEMLPEIAPSRRPRHIALIMDGNGRWAEERGLPRIEGHRQGVQTVRMVCETSARLGLDAITLYCLSSENWKRPAAELEFLMHLLEQYLIEERRMLMENNLRLEIIGRRDRLPATALREMEKTCRISEANSGTRIVLAIDYGGRDELTRAVRSLAQEVAAGSLAAEAIDEALLARHLDTRDLPDPDLLIRTGGDLRVSNFLLWQISYAELWVTRQCWPAFEQSHFLDAIRDFARRDRRFGGLSV